MYQHNLWRNDCSYNPCSPQGGTWYYDRAGWCPGASAPPWDIMYTNFSPGEIVEFYYEIQPYTNYCRPNNPDCISGVTCADCAYNSGGHTQPNYSLAGNAILYRAPLSSSRPAPLPQEMALYQNVPNPFNAQTSVRFDVPQRSRVQIAVFNIIGQEVARPVDDVYVPGRYRVLFDASALPSGMYLCRLEANGFSATKKMLLMK